MINGEFHTEAQSVTFTALQLMMLENPDSRAEDEDSTLNDNRV